MVRRAPPLQCTLLRGDNVLRNHAKAITLICVLALLAVGGCGQQKDPVGKAKLHLKRHQYADAIKTLTSAPPELLNTYDAQVLLARAYTGTAKYDESIAAYKKAASLDKGRPGPYIGMAEMEEVRAEKASTNANKAKHQMRALEHCQTAKTIDEKNPEVYAVIARLHEARGDIEKTLGARRSAIKHDPTNPSRKLDLARALLRFGRTEEATAIVDKALDQDPSLAEARVMRAAILRGSRKPGSLEEARKELALALSEERIPRDVRELALNDLAFLCLQLGDLEEANKRALELAKSARFKGAAVYVQGSVLLRQGKPKEAYEKLKRLEGAKHPQLLMQLAFAEERLQMQNQAIGHYQKIVEEIAPRYLPAHLALARLMLTRRLYPEAMKHCNTVLEERPGNERALRIKAQIHRSPSGKLHDNELARVCYLKILVQDPQSRDANLDLADLYLDLGRADAAIGHAARANSASETARGHLALGRAYLLKHYAGRDAATGPTHLQTATTHLEKAHAAAEANALVASWLARAYAAAKKTDKAVDLLRGYVSKNPQQGLAYAALAGHFESVPNLPAAIKTLERAAAVPGIVNFDPGALGRAYFLAGRYKDAIAVWQQMLTGENTQHAPVALRIGLAVALATDGQHAKALTQAGAVVHQLTDDRGGGALLAACIALQAGQHARATEFLETRTYASPKSKASYLSLVEQCRKAGANGKKAAQLMSEGLMHTEFRSPDAAVKRFETAAKLVPESIAPHYLLASTLLRARRYKDLPPVFTRIFEKFPTEGFAHYHFAVLGRYFPTKIKYREQLEFALDLDSELAVAHVALADALLRESVGGSSKAPLLEAAVRHCDEALKLQDGGTRASLETAARVNYAMTKLRRDEFVRENNPDEVAAKRALADESANTTRKLLQTLQTKFPSSLQAIRTRVRFELNEQQYAAAADQAGSFMRNQRSDDHELRLLLIVALMKQGQLDAKPAKLELAREMLTHLLKTNPTDVAAYRQLVNLYVIMERPDLVVATLRRLLALDRRNVQLAFELAVAHLKFNQPARAKVVYESIAKTLRNAPVNQTTTLFRHSAAIGIARSLMLIPTSTEADRTANIRTAMETLGPLTRPPSGQKPNVEAMLLYGGLLEEVGKPVNALAVYQKCEALSPKAYGPQRVLALFHYKQRQHGKVIDIFRKKVLPRRRYHPFEYSRLVLAYVGRNEPGDFAKASPLAAKARDLVARRPQPEQELPREIARFYYDTNVLVYVANRKFYDARSEIKNIPKMDVMARDSYTHLVSLCARDVIKRQQFVSLFADHLFYHSLGGTDDSAAALEKLLAKFPGNYYLLMRLAELHRLRNKMEKLAATMEQQVTAAGAAAVVITDSDHEKLYVELIDTYLVRLAPSMEGALAKADSACARALKKWPKSVEILDRQATVRIQQKNTAAAVQVLNRAIAAAKQGSEPWVRTHKRLALVYAGLKEIEKTLVICEKIEKHTESDAAWQNNWGWFLATAPTPRFEKAVERANRAKTLEPANAEIRDTLGWILYLAGEHQRAHPELKYAAQQSPQDPNIAYHFGANHAKLRQYKEALEALQKAMELSRKGRTLNAMDACKKLIEEMKAKLKPASP